MCDETTNRLDEIRLIKSLGYNYPVMKDWGISFPKPLLVIVDPNQGTAAWNCLTRATRTVQVDEHIRKKRFEEIMGTARSDFIAYMFSPAKGSMEFLDILSTVAKRQYMGETPVTAVILIIAEGIPVGIDRSGYFSIYLEGNLQDMEMIDEEEVVPSDERLLLVRDRLPPSSGVSSEEYALLAAAAFLYPCLEQENRESRYESLIDHARKLVRLDDESNDMEGLDEFAVQCLLDWQKEQHFSNVIQLSVLKMEGSEKLLTSIFYDEEYVWLSDNLFGEIMKPLRKVFSIPVIKQAMADADILCGDRKGTYTSKMRYKDISGNYVRKRMIRLRRKRLAPVGEMDFIELCKGEGVAL